LDKKLLTYWKLCRKKKQRPQENWTVLVASWIWMRHLSRLSAS
jgi:hypothetical protein